MLHVFVRGGREAIWIMSLDGRVDTVVISTV